jgi:hypothetical protein
MRQAGSSPLRPLVVGVVAGLIVGLLIGLLIGWVIWPVQYVGEAYTYELNQAEKLNYMAAVVDSYSLTGQLDAVQQRLSRWNTQEQLDTLAMLFATYQAEGRMQEATRVVDLSKQLARADGWGPQIIGQETGQLVQQYTQQGAPDKAQAASLFANELGASAVASSAPTGSAQPSPGGQASNVRLLVSVCGVLLLLAVLVLAALILTRGRRPAQRVVSREPEAEWSGVGPQPLLQKMSSYSSGMDNFDESFAVETAEDEWLGECGMGISESIGEGSPRRVVAFEVWLFDKLNTRTVTKVLMSDYANSNEALLNKLSARGDPVLATPGQTFTLETPDLSVDARVVEMEYAEGPPKLGYFETLKVQLTVYRKADTSVSGEMA